MYLKASTLPTADSWYRNPSQDSAPVCINISPEIYILISLQRWQHRVRNETKHFVSPHLIGPQLHQYDLVSKQRWLDYHNQHESASLIGLFHAASLVLPPVESYRKPTQSTGVPLLSAAESRRHPEIREYSKKC